MQEGIGLMKYADTGSYQGEFKKGKAEGKNE